MSDILPLCSFVLEFSSLHGLLVGFERLPQPQWMSLVYIVIFSQPTVPIPLGEMVGWSMRTSMAPVEIEKNKSFKILCCE